MLLVSGIAAGLVSWLLRRTVDTVAKATVHAQIVRLFGEHVSPGVVAELLARPDGHWSEVRLSAVLVADLRGFSRYSETRAPSKCAGTLNACLAVHYGNVLSGLVGAANRREFTVIGDVVNLAFRMERQTRRSALGWWSPPRPLKPLAFGIRSIFRASRARPQPPGAAVPSGLILNKEKWPVIVTRSFGYSAFGAFGFWAVLGAADWFSAGPGRSRRVWVE